MRQQVKNSTTSLLKSQVGVDAPSGEINKAIRETLAEKSSVFNDKSTSYLDIADYIELHITEKSSKILAESTLKWKSI
jgi:hypothetical protein